jgi:hypothetical protein
MFRPFAVRDGLLITGQQQFSGAAAARLVIEALGRQDGGERFRWRSPPRPPGALPLAEVNSACSPWKVRLA